MFYNSETMVTRCNSDNWDSTKMLSDDPSHSYLGDRLRVSWHQWYYSTSVLMTIRACLSKVGHRQKFNGYIKNLYT